MNTYISLSYVYIFTTYYFISGLLCCSFISGSCFNTIRRYWIWIYKTFCVVMYTGYCSLNVLWFSPRTKMGQIGVLHLIHVRDHLMGSGIQSFYCWQSHAMWQSFEIVSVDSTSKNVETQKKHLKIAKYDGLRCRWS